MSVSINKRAYAYHITTKCQYPSCTRQFQNIYIIKKPARHQNNGQHQHLIKQSAYTFRVSFHHAVWFQTKSQGFSAWLVGLFLDRLEAHAALYPGVLAPSTSSSREGPVNVGALLTKVHSVHNTKQSTTIYIAAYKRLYVELQGMTTAGVPYQARGCVTWYLTPSQPLGSCQGRTNVENDILFKHASLKLEKNNERTQKAEIRTEGFQSARKWAQNTTPTLNIVAIMCQ